MALGAILWSGLALVGGGAATFALMDTEGISTLPEVVFPVGNEFSEEKRVLGKILFWDEQLSSDNTMACATCHIPSQGGADDRLDINPGPDGIFGNADDILGSPGVMTQDSEQKYAFDQSFGIDVQVTGRQAQSAILAMYAPSLFWDGRAGDQFVDPQTGEVVLESGAALESQAVGPILSSVEMAHQGRNWDEVTDKLARSRPLALAADAPPDLASAISDVEFYPELFERAFGDREITAARIGMAIATYERTLVADQTPFDAFLLGDTTAMTPAQINGWNAFQASRCAACHQAPLFTDNSFRNIGLRPIAEDAGRQNVTGLPEDAGRFRTPSLRNLALRDRFMHNGQLVALGRVFDFYARRNGQLSFAENRDPLLNAPIEFPQETQRDVSAFLTGGLLDPRVASETFPFDRPTLNSERAEANPAVLGSGTPGTGGIRPKLIALTPPNLGNMEFKIGVSDGLPGATATIGISTAPPGGDVLIPEEELGPVILDSNGVGTFFYPIPDEPSLDGTKLYLQWRIVDQGSPSGRAFSPIAELTLFCSRSGPCVKRCPADLTNDGVVDFLDVQAFLAAFQAMESAADLTGDGVYNFFDVQAFLNAFEQGCA